MAKLGTLQLAVLGFVVGLMFWGLFIKVTHTPEPWDHPYFILAYVSALLISIGLGAIAKGSAWLAGALVVMAMLPVMLAVSGNGPLIVVGILLLMLLSAPCAGVAALSANRKRPY
ncbi:MAG: hypothetical protein COW16_01490 [Sphingomonadales bacterium CG12_big_fil_rev_8_21_14_0_65_65_10]|uniref:Uncharacterized protein n=1 Tax=Blastomonas marina TaxID=1867408 RepID=A0ABQ1FCX5_9SPHN|nr:hypothetical protein [Blastomonas marina]PIW56319.1 MAG: hypothetical protein COW16_01490 [Sphingomonadales bacterium CG12_big_fil_rev_8_21_14_0_65_65_10]WPZ05168.1 hypothetical protein T8S45_06435 [Blastomonas marina]GGA06408.1 hypothetical protein GCM10010923_15340 [Blastomonas marina]